MKDVLNPYIAGAPVVETSMFFGREDVFGWIDRSLAGKFVDHILVIHGQRRVGKTSVLKQIPNFLPEKYIQVFFDLQGRTNTTLDRFLWWLAREIARTLKQRAGISLPRPDQNAFAQDYEILINEFLPAVRAVLDEQILLLTFDEFDTLDQAEIQETLAEPLIAYLRRMMELPGLNFIFSIGSSGNKLENMQASYTDFFKAALYRKISFLAKDDCFQLVNRPVEGVLTYDRKAFERIYAITSGHPYFTQLMCHELFSLCQKTGAREIRANDVEAVLDDVIERGTVNLKFVWDEASDLEKWILASLAQMESGTKTRELSSVIQKQRIRFSESDLNSALIHLKDKDVLSEGNEFIIHLMRLWLQRNRPLERVREELIEVNPIANRYIEIGDEYRDMQQFQEAHGSYQQALDVDPGNLRALVNIGGLHLLSEEYTQAIDVFDKALGVDDEDVTARAGVCDANLALGDEALTRDELDMAVDHYQRVLVINTAHTDARQRLADIFWKQAEAKLESGEDDEALSAFNQALEFTPEDDRLSARYHEVLEQKKSKVIADWLEKADDAHSHQSWDEAIAAVEEALRLAPDDEKLIARLAEAKDAPRLHEMDVLREQIDQAKAQGDWNTAAEAIDRYEELSPGSPGVEEEIAEIQEQQRLSQMAAFKAQAESFVRAEDWGQAVLAWEKYLSFDPPDREDANITLEHARKYERIASDYAEAEQALRKKRFNQAIELFQKIIAQDPSYKATSRLLAEAVEANRREPIWRKPWLYVTVGIVAVAISGIIFGPNLIKQFTAVGERSAPATQPPATYTESPILASEATSVPEIPSTPTPHPGDVFAALYLAYIAETSPDFEDDFSALLPDWRINVDGNPQSHYGEFMVDGVFEFNVEPPPEGRNLSFGDFQDGNPLSGINFVLQLDLHIIDIGESDELIIRFRAEDPWSGYNLFFKNDGSWSVALEGIPGTIANGPPNQINIHETNQITLIAIENEVAVLVNDQIVTYLSDVEHTGEFIVIEFTAQSSYHVQMDNVKFWNLGAEDAAVDSFIATQVARVTATAKAAAGYLLYQVQEFGEISSLDWSVDGHLAVAGNEHRLVILDAMTGEHLQEIPDLRADVYVLDWHPEGHELATSQGSVVRIYENPGDDQTYTDLLVGWGQITDLSYSPDGDRMAVVTEMGALSVWDRIPDGWRFSIMEWAGSNRVFDVDWDADGERLLTVSEDNRIEIWDATNLRGERIELWYTSESAAWSPDGNFIAVGDHGYERPHNSPFIEVLSVVDDETYRQRGSGIVPSGIVNELAWSPDESVITAACSDGTVRMWTGFERSDDRTSLFDEINKFTVGVAVIDLVWSPDGGVLVAGDASGYIWAWRIADVPMVDSVVATQVARVTATAEAASQDHLFSSQEFEEISSLDWSVDGYLAIAGNDNRLVILEGISWESAMEITGTRAEVHVLDWHPEGHELATGQGDAVRVYTFPGDNQTYEDLLVGRGEITDLSYSPDGDRLAAVTEMGILSVWDRISNGWGFTHIERVGSTEILDVAWDATGEHLLTVSGIAEESVFIWDAENWEINYGLAYTSESASWSPLGTYLAIADHSFGMVPSAPLVLVIKDGNETGRAVMASGVANELAWAPDESVIAAACSDGTVRLWVGFEGPGSGITHLDEVLKFTLGVPVIDLVWSPDGSMLAAGDAEGNIWVWRTPEVVE